MIPRHPNTYLPLAVAEAALVSGKSTQIPRLAHQEIVQLGYRSSETIVSAPLQDLDAILLGNHIYVKNFSLRRGRNGDVVSMDVYHVNNPYSQDPTDPIQLTHLGRVEDIDEETLLVIGTSNINHAAYDPNTVGINLNSRHLRIDSGTISPDLPTMPHGRRLVSVSYTPPGGTTVAPYHTLFTHSQGYTIVEDLHTANGTQVAIA